MQMLLQFDQLFPLAFLQSRNRNVRPARNNFGDVFLSHFFAQQRWLPILRRFGCCIGQFSFQLGNASVLNLARLGKLTTTLRALELGTKLIKLLLPFPLFFENGFFLLPLGFEGTDFFFQLRQFLLELLQDAPCLRDLFLS